MKKQKTSRVPAVISEVIERKIYFVRGHKVMLDSDLAELYQVPTSRLNEAVKRNLNRFPSNFMFRLTSEEDEALISQIAISKTGRGGRRKLPYVFSEQGVAMLSSVLNSDRAIQVNIAIMNTFVKIRSLLITHEDLIRRLNKLEDEYDENFRVVFQAINNLLKTPEPPRKKIGFDAGGEPEEGR